MDVFSTAGELHDGRKLLTCVRSSIRIRQKQKKNGRASKCLSTNFALEVICREFIATLVTRKGSLNQFINSESSACIKNSTGKLCGMRRSQVRLITNPTALITSRKLLQTFDKKAFPIHRLFFSEIVWSIRTQNSRVSCTCRASRANGSSVGEKQLFLTA